MQGDLKLAPSLGDRRAARALCQLFGGASTPTDTTNAGNSLLAEPRICYQPGLVEACSAALSIPKDCAAPGPPITYDPIARIPAPDVDRFRREYERSGQPVIITGLVDQWRLAREWSLERFVRTYADSRVICLKIQPDGRLAASKKEPARFERVSLTQFVAALRSDQVKTDYMSAPLTNFTPRFDGEFVLPPYCAGAPSCRSVLWLGPSGTVTPLHFDVAENLFAQISGRKRVVMYPRSQTRLVYPYPPWSRWMVVARVNPELPDLRQFPRFAHARPVGCILEPGEMLFIPARWWHQVRALDESVSMSFWYGGYKVAALNFAAALFRRLSGMQKSEWYLDDRSDGERRIRIPPA